MTSVSFRLGGEAMEFFHFLIIFVALGFILYGFYQSAQQEDAWRATAKRLNLTFDEGGWLSTMSMGGTYRGKKLEVRHEKERRGGRRNRRTVHYAAIEVSLGAPCWRQISLSKHGFMDSVAKFFGGQDQEVGDSRFDAQFRIKGRMDGKVRQCLNNPNVQAAIRGMSRSYGSFVLTEGAVCIRERGMFTCESELTRMIERVVDVAEELDAAAVGGESTAGDAEDELFPDFQSQKPAGDEEPSPIW